MAKTGSMRRRSTIGHGVFLAFLLELLSRGKCFYHSPGKPFRVLNSIYRSHSRSYSHPRDRTEEGSAGRGGMGVPDMLRDIVVEKIEEIGGGKVKEVRSSVHVAAVGGEMGLRL